MKIQLNNLVSRIPDFYEDNFNPGRRDAMKAMSALTVGASSLLLPALINNETAFDVGLSLACASGVLFFGYVGKSVYKNIKNELKDYNF